MDSPTSGDGPAGGPDDPESARWLPGRARSGHASGPADARAARGLQQPLAGRAAGRQDDFPHPAAAVRRDHRPARGARQAVVLWGHRRRDDPRRRAARRDGRAAATRPGRRPEVAGRALAGNGLAAAGRAGARTVRRAHAPGAGRGLASAGRPIRRLRRRLYGLAQLFRAAPAAAEISPRDLRRRRLLRLAGLGGLAVVVGGVGVWQLVESLARRSAGAVSTVMAQGLAKLPAEVTPVDEFYSVSKNFFTDPTVDGASWRLEVGGKVERPFTISYDELRALPPVEDYRTLICISNEVGGDLIGNAHWRGVRLRDLLDRAGPAPGAYKVVFTCADDYTDSIHLEKAVHPDTLLVYEMNGAPLPPKHGYPARLLVPDIYGMKNVKWLRKIEVSTQDYRGFWQQRGWDDEAVIKTMSRIDTVKSYSAVNDEPLLLGGIAFAGARGIDRVEYSVDGGQTWQDAELKPPLGFATWVLWVAEWTPPGPGQYTVKVRATDKTGVVQTALVADPLPDGASGLHAVVLRTLAS